MVYIALLHDPIAAAANSHPTRRHAIARRVPSSRIDVEQMKGWIAACADEHTDTCARRPNRPLGKRNLHELPTIRFVDVINKCIAELPPTKFPVYAALSYVWGSVFTTRLSTHNRTSLLEPGILRKLWSRLPRTIRDAIKLTKQLGMQYLWVDSLCLVQNDPQDVENGIRLMDCIYEEAAVTIVAASGDHADYGIPGVASTGRTLAHRIVEVKPGVEVIACQQFNEALKNAPYSKRAWT
ncbi:HET-domain-containing protein, partial [Trichodelitschia bisporula]